MIFMARSIHPKCKTGGKKKRVPALGSGTKELPSTLTRTKCEHVAPTTSNLVISLSSIRSNNTPILVLYKQRWDPALAGRIGSTIFYFRAKPMGRVVQGLLVIRTLPKLVCSCFVYMTRNMTSFDGLCVTCRVTTVLSSSGVYWERPKIVSTNYYKNVCKNNKEKKENMEVWLLSFIEVDVESNLHQCSLHSAPLEVIFRIVYVAKHESHNL